MQIIRSDHATPLTREFFQALEMRRTQALVDGNISIFEELHAPEYELITPAGKIFSRSEYLKIIQAGQFYSGWAIGELNCRISSGMVILRYRARLLFPSGRELQCWHTDSYELRATGWQATWSQATEIAKPNNQG